MIYNTKVELVTQIRILEKGICRKKIPSFDARYRANCLKSLDRSIMQQVSIVKITSRPLRSNFRASTNFCHVSYTIKTSRSRNPNPNISFVMD